MVFDVDAAIEMDWNRKKKGGGDVDDFHEVL